MTCPRSRRKLVVSVSYYGRFKSCTAIPTAIIQTPYALQQKAAFAFVIKYEVAQIVRYAINEALPLEN